ncbi:MAG: BFD-like [2Fe-2S] binding domain [Deltaproteobacteria bacterium]|nr:BFD-like [2Fe-2S] binding domain [Deltaproteobacteria bacterium]
MIVCLCANVSERELVATITAGAATVKEVGRRCGAGAGCGACKPLIRACLSRCRAVAVQEEAAVVASVVITTPVSV